MGQEVTVEILEVDLDRERVSLSLKATQEDPWQVFARTHAIGQVAPGKVTKLVPFGAFVRVADGIEGLVHISELSGKHVELAEQVVSVGDEVFVKVIDIDLERRRISLSLKQANEGVDPEGTEFDPALYGMVTEYDDQGNYKYPEGFDPETNEWKEGFESQREEWEQQYAAAQARWEAHKRQVAKGLEEAAADTALVHLLVRVGQRRNPRRRRVARGSAREAQLQQLSILHHQERPALRGRPFRRSRARSAPVGWAGAADRTHRRDRLRKIDHRLPPRLARRRRRGRRPHRPRGRRARHSGAGAIARALR